MARVSVGVAVLGVLVTAALVAHLSRRTSQGSPQWYWFLGLAGLLPAWLLAFVALLGRAPMEGRPDLSSSVPWIVSSALALLGLIVTDALFRRLSESRGDHRPAIYWLIGLLTFLPAWAVALVGLVVTGAAK